MRQSAGALKMPAVSYPMTRLGGGMSSLGQPYAGGLDQTTPSLQLQSGALRSVLNFECNQSGGYSRVGGYERSDGRTAPSAAVYKVVQIALFVNIPTVGVVLTQAVSGATGILIAYSSDPVPFLVMTSVTGIFDLTNQITSPGPVIIGSAVLPTVAISAKRNAQYSALAANVYRALIQPVPGSGTVRGVVGMLLAGVDEVFAFRPNAGGTAVNVYKQTGGGWVQVPLLNIVKFSAGNGPIPLDGATLVQGGVFSIIRRIVWAAGTWAGTANGAFVINVPTGGNFAAGLASIGATTVNLAGAQAAITLAPGGRFEFVKCNFSGQSPTRRIYGVDGVNQAFEFDGVVLAPIATFLASDSPNHIAYHKNVLWISKDSSILGSPPGLPFKWNALDGAVEIATGDTVSGMLTLPGDQTTASMGVWMRNSTAVLYGSDPGTFRYVVLNTGAGARPYSIQNQFDSFVFDDLGVISLQATISFGNFFQSSLTHTVLPFVATVRDKLTASSVSRTKGQYRTYFSDGSGLWITLINKQYIGASIITFLNPVFSIDTGSTSRGEEFTYFGSSDGLGYVYQLDKGSSFDGAPIQANATLAWDPLKSPRVLKRFRAASLEVQGTGYAEITFSYQLGYGSANIPQQDAVVLSGNYQAPLWDSGSWDLFVWDGQNLQPNDVSITGTGENIQVTLSAYGDYMYPFTLNSLIYHVTQRRGVRV